MILIASNDILIITFAVDYEFYCVGILEIMINELVLPHSLCEIRYVLLSVNVENALIIN